MPIAVALAPPGTGGGETLALDRAHAACAPPI